MSPMTLHLSSSSLYFLVYLVDYVTIKHIAMRLLKVKEEFAVNWLVRVDYGKIHINRDRGIGRSMGITLLKIMKMDCFISAILHSQRQNASFLQKANTRSVA